MPLQTELWLVFQEKFTQKKKRMNSYYVTAKCFKKWHEMEPNAKL